MTNLKINLLMLILVLFASGTSYLAFRNNCFGECGIWTISSLVKPVFFGGLALSASLALLLFFPGTIFKQWLRHVAIWYIPLSTLFVLSIPRSGGGMLMPDRGVTALQLMAVLFVITVIYAFVQYWRESHD